MFTDLNNLLDVGVQSLPIGKRFVILERAPANGTFVLCHLLSLYLRAGCSVCLIGMSQTFTHYNCIANKLMLNLPKLRDSKQFVFIDAVRVIGADIVSGQSSGNVSSGGGSKNSLKKLYILAKDSLEALRNWPEQQTLLLVDDISVLTSMGHRPFDVATLVHYLQTLVCTESRSGSMACLVHATEDEDESDEIPLHRIIGHHCDVIISVKGLKTGYCRDLDGEISVRWLTTTYGKPIRQPQTMHYKLSDRNVTLAPLGMSSVVL